MLRAQRLTESVLCFAVASVALAPRTSNVRN